MKAIAVDEYAPTFLLVLSISLFQTASNCWTAKPFVDCMQDGDQLLGGPIRCAADCPSLCASLCTDTFCRRRTYIPFALLSTHSQVVSKSVTRVRGKY
mmetsp:Transcript_42661/g.118807  ORF Transcript_42661/g.118807 Transcript_42661/m.118807 type:complete len:98 (-) Transcript_42661:751-1044(-)